MRLSRIYRVLPEETFILWKSLSDVNLRRHNQTYLYQKLNLYSDNEAQNMTFSRIYVKYLFNVGAGMAQSV